MNIWIIFTLIFNILFLILFVSGNRKIIATMFIIHNIILIRNGVLIPKFNKSPHNAGQIINHIQKTAQNIHKFDVRSF
ncbi:MAG: hypothetical protein WCG25_01905 [bacterium]